MIIYNKNKKIKAASHKAEGILLLMMNKNQLSDKKVI
jgi:hypothetical protein